MSKPKAAFDMRHYILLTQILAECGSENELRRDLLQLIEGWHVPLRDDTPPSLVGTYDLLTVLAQFIVHYHYEEQPSTWQHIAQDMIHSWDG